MKKLLKNKKALSPVVAAIILIAVTVAVSIAVAAWMGQMTFTFMETEEMRIASSTFSTTTGNVTLTCVNTGSTDITLTAATVTGGGQGTRVGVLTNTAITAGATVQVTISGLTGGLTDGSTYTAEVVTSGGNAFTTVGTAN